MFLTTVSELVESGHGVVIPTWSLKILPYPYSSRILAVTWVSMGQSPLMCSSFYVWSPMHHLRVSSKGFHWILWIPERHITTIHRIFMTFWMFPPKIPLISLWTVPWKLYLTPAFKILRLKVPPLSWASRHEAWHHRLVPRVSLQLAAGHTFLHLP